MQYRKHIKPASEQDLYQLGMAAYHGTHGCVVTLAPEGTYWYHETSWPALQALVHDTVAFYRRNGYSEAGVRRAMRACRQPLPKYVDARSEPYLYRLLPGLSRAYHALMDAHVSPDELQRPEDQEVTMARHARIARDYGRHVREELGIEMQFDACSPAEYGRRGAANGPRAERSETYRQPLPSA